jgi:hypothetical protein
MNDLRGPLCDSMELDADDMQRREDFVVEEEERCVL